MSLKARVEAAQWVVTCQTEETPRGFMCSIGLEHPNVEGGRFAHRFRHASTYVSESDALLAGLREGLTWIGLKTAKTIAV
jgi:hypothetical protein